MSATVQINHPNAQAKPPAVFVLLLGKGRGLFRSLCAVSGKNVSEARVCLIGEFPVLGFISRHVLQCMSDNLW